MLVRFFQSEAGAVPVQDYLDGLSASELAPILAAFRDLATNGHRESSVNKKPLDGKLWELKVGNHRLTYVVYDFDGEPLLMLLHAFKKEGQKTPKGDLKVSGDRMKLALLAEGARRVKKAADEAKRKAEEAKKGKRR